MKQEMDFSRAFGRADREFTYCVNRTLEELTSQKEVKMKKKISLGLIFAIVLVILATGTALALTVGWGHIEQAMDLAVENGAYWEWDVNAKIELIEAMKADGLDVSDKDMQALRGQDMTEAEKNALADRVLTAYYGDEEYLYWGTMAEKEWGAPQTWTLEQRHWFWNTLREKGLYGDNSFIDVLPEEGDLTAEAAVKIAKAAVAEAYDLSDAEMEAYYPNVSFFTTDVCDTPRWMIVFHERGENGHLFGEKYTVLLTRDGKVTEDWEDMGVLTPEHARQKEEADRESAMDAWQDRAARKLRDMETVYYNPAGGTYYHFLPDCPLVNEKYLPLREIGKDEPEFAKLSACPVCALDQIFWSAADKVTYLVGDWQMPDESWINEERAVQIARASLEEQGKKLDKMYPAVFTGTAGEPRAIYIVYFSEVSLDRDGHFGWDPDCMAMIDGKTGEIIQAGDAGSNG